MNSETTENNGKPSATTINNDSNEEDYGLNEAEVEKSLENLSEVDFYSVLNVSRDATPEEIKASYKRLCLLFHPDKQLVPEKKELAERQFIKVQKAFDVLSNEKSRYIYDKYGSSAAEECWDLVQKVSGASNMSPDQIIREWELRKKEAEEKRLEDGWTTEGQVSVTVNAVPVWDVEEGIARYGSVPISERMPEISSISIQQKFEKALLYGWTGFAQCGLQTIHGSGRGNFNFGLYKHVSISSAIMASERVHPDFKMSLAIGDEPSAVFLFKKRITPSLTTDFKVHGSYSNGFITPVFGVSVTSELLTGLSGSVGVDIGARSSISLGLTSKDENSTIGANLIVSGGAVLAQAKYIKKIGERTRLKMKLSNASIAAGTIHELSPRSSISNLLEINLKTGVLFYFNWKRMGHTFQLPIILSVQPNLKMAVLGSLIPTTVAILVRNFIIEPRRKRQKQLRLDRFKEEKKALLEKVKSEAQEAQLLLRESALRKFNEEAEKEGLTIEYAFFGKLSEIEQITDDLNRSQSLKTPINSEDLGKRSDDLSFTGSNTLNVIDVTIPLQSMVSSSQLSIASTTQSKSHLIGFYDPYIGEQKHLRVIYRFGKGRRLHQVTIEDKMGLFLPMRSHIVNYS